MTISRMLSELDGRLRLLWAGCVGLGYFAAWLTRRTAARLAPRHGSLAELDTLRRAGAI